MSREWNEALLSEIAILRDQLAAAEARAGQAEKRAADIGDAKRELELKYLDALRASQGTPQTSLGQEVAALLLEISMTASVTPVMQWRAKIAQERLAVGASQATSVVTQQNMTAAKPKRSDGDACWVNIQPADICKIAALSLTSRSTEEAVVAVAGFLQDRADHEPEPQHQPTSPAPRQPDVTAALLAALKESEQAIHSEYCTAICHPACCAVTAAIKLAESTPDTPGGRG